MLSYTVHTFQKFLYGLCLKYLPQVQVLVQLQ